MLAYLRLKNVALIDEIEIEFGRGLNLLTGETGSGKSIIVDSLSSLTGERISLDIIKSGEVSARIDGEFLLDPSAELEAFLDEVGIEYEADANQQIPLIVRRDLSKSGKNRIFVNSHLITLSVLKRLGNFLVAIHGQGEQSELFSPASHIDLLDSFAKVEAELVLTANAYRQLAGIKYEIEAQKASEADRLQLLDVLTFQVNELNSANLQIGEDDELQVEKLRLNNIEKLSALSKDAYNLLYDNVESTVSTLEKAATKIEALSEIETKFRDLPAALRTSLAVVEDVSIQLRDYANRLESSPERLEQIETRLAEIVRVTKKYGGAVASAIEHLATSSERLSRFESSEIYEKELSHRYDAARAEFLAHAAVLHKKRVAAADKFEKAIVKSLASVAMERAKFEIRFDETDPADDRNFSLRGFDRVEFFISANPGEAPKPLAKIASGGESSRLMLVLKTLARETSNYDVTNVFDEIDSGIGGRVAEAVGANLKTFASNRQVLCVTHQPQVASQADFHFVVVKSIAKNKTQISVRELSEVERVNEIARMLAGEKVTEAARDNAREMIAGRR